MEDFFSLHSTKQTARRGTLKTAHGSIETPFFMPIATKGAVKTLSSKDMQDLGAQILLSNTYHLFLRPGTELMKDLGGLHKLMNWDGPILTDSGGYQVFSLGDGKEMKSRVQDTSRPQVAAKIFEDGVEFRSHIDGSKQFLSPEDSMMVQTAIGSDMFMQFDDVAAGNSTKERYQDAMERSFRWAKRSKDAFESYKENQGRALFGIVQGGIHEDLREVSAKVLMDIGFDGYAIGGLSVGEGRKDAFRITKHITDMLPEDKPRYFMGGGFPEEIVYYVSVGVDMFDCVLPSRNARHGTLFMWKDEPMKCVSKALKIAFDGGSDKKIASVLYNQIRISNESFARDESPIDPYGLSDYSKAYLRHLFTVQESLAQRLATIQNLGFYLRLMRELRLLLS